VSDVSVLLRDAASAEQFAKGYLAYLATLLPRVDTAAIARVIEVLDRARREQHTVFIAGNGGSAATASHMATDLGALARLTEDERPLRVLALTDNTALMTATANDHGYAEVFVTPLRMWYRPGDVFLGISASGNSPNVLAAARWVKARAGRVLGLVGFDGGALKELCDVVIHIPTPRGEYGPVEDLHLMVNHLITAWLQHRLCVAHDLLRVRGA